MNVVTSYIPILVARVGSGASAFLVVKLASGGKLEAGLVLAAYPYLEALGALIAGRWSDFFGRKKTLLVGYVVRSVAMLALAWAFYTHESPLLEAALNGIIGFTTAFILTASLAMATDLTERRNRGIGMGGFELVNFLSYGVGYLAGSVLYAIFQNAIAYLAVALATAAAIPVFAAYLSETRPEAPTERKFLLSVLPPSAVALLPVWFGLTTMIGMAMYIPRVLDLGNAGGLLTRVVDRLGDVSVGLLYIGALTTLGGGAVFFGSLSDKWGRMRTFRIGLAGGVLALVTLNAALYAGLDLILSFAVAVPLLFLASAMGPSILALIGDEASIHYRGTVMGIYSVMLGLGIGFGSTLAGAVAHVYHAAELYGLAHAALAVFLAMTAIHIALDWTIRKKYI